MIVTLMYGALAAAQVLLVLALTFALIRLLRGPRAQDRVLALDTMYVNAMLLVVTYGMSEGSEIYFEVALGIGMLGFVATAAAAKFLWRGEVIE